MDGAPKLSTDVVVLGAGLAGFCAALAAAEAGADVVLVEKMPRHGGSTIQSGGSFAFAGTDAQRAAGVEDGAERLRADLLKAGANKNDAGLVDLYAEKQLETYAWLKAHGVAFGPIALSSSMSVPRTHPVDPVLMMEELRQRIEARSDIRLMWSCAATRIRHGGQDQAITLTAVAEGRAPVQIAPRRGVVIATGGFSRSELLLERYAPQLRQALRSGGAGNTGDGFLMGLALGADHRDVGYIKGTFGVSLNSFPEVSYEAADDAMLIISMFKGAIVVNTRGERFVDESISYKTIGDACLKQPDGVGFQVFDDRIMQKSSPLPTSNDFRRAEREGLLHKSETLQGLAVELKLDPETFAATIKRYNDGVAAGVDAEFGRTGLGSGYGERPKIEVPPFYGFPCMTSVLATYCGLAVDRSMQLLNPFGELIPGVFAAGEVVGGLHGENYMSGSSLSKSAIFGVVAGESAARLRNRP